MFAAHGELRTDAGEINRSTDEGLAHAVAIGGVIASVALFVGVTHGGVGLATVSEPGR
ncbi:hypothetical protein D3C76_1854160 [compost metagenome]